MGASSLLLNLGSAILPLLGSFLVSVLLFPYLGKTATGYYITAMAAATFILIVAKFGVQAATSRLVSEHEDDPGPWLRAGLWIRSLFTLPSVVLSVILAPYAARWLEGPELVAPFWWVGAIVFSTSYYELGSEGLVGLRRFGDLFASRTLFLVLRLSAVFVVRSSGLGVAAFLAGHATAQALSASAIWTRLLRVGGTNVDSVSTKEARGRVLAISWPLALSSASFLIYAQTDKLMLAWLRDAPTVGDFGVARIVLDATLFPTFALAWTLRPNLIRALKENGDGDVASQRLAEGLRYSIAFAAGASALVYAYGPALLVGIYGDEFRLAGDLLRSMVPILVLRGVGTPIFPGLLATDQQASYAKLMAWTAGLNVVANLALIPPLGAVGAVYATILSLLPLTIGGFLKLQGALGLPLRPYWASHGAALLGAAAIVATASLIPAPDTLAMTLAHAAVAGALFLAIVLPLGRRPRSA